MHGHTAFTDESVIVRLATIVAIWVATTTSTIAASQAPSVDCTKARGVIEQTICHDAELAVLDKQLQQAFTVTLAAMPAAAASAIRTGQRDWLGYRNECERPINAEGVSVCLKKRIEARIGRPGRSVETPPLVVA
uniref:lysozyme inhibitor LprI family protein n=1 Tax=Burkholderia arboris TaxID=488730 RepID=UPI003BEF050F